MRILLDHNVPAPLRYALRGHAVETAYERGWSELSNGALISAAQDAGFDLLITTDKGIRHQQNWSGRTLALLVLSTNDWTRLRLARERVLAEVEAMGASSFVELAIPPAQP
jgi:hypothetical protein